MPKISFLTADGLGTADITALKMTPLGGPAWEYAVEATAVVTTDNTGNFVVDISSLNLTEIADPIPTAVVDWGDVPVTSAMLAQAALANVSYKSLTKIRGYVQQPNTIVVGGLTIKLANAPIKVSLRILGKTAS